MLAIETKLSDMDKNSSEYISQKRLADQLDTEQYLYKILLNSTYGVLANRFFALYDLDCAKSITLTGQALIRQSEKIANEYMQKEWNLIEKDRAVAMDTDSVAGDSLIRTSIGAMSIEELYNLYKSDNSSFIVRNHEVIYTEGLLKCMTYDKFSNEAVLGNATAIIRHKVSKRRFRIKTKERYIDVTDDHSCMVVRNNELIEIKPSQILLTDKLLTIQNCVDSNKYNSGPL